MLAVPIELQSWPDPQGDVVLHHSREGCAIYFGCWTTNAEPAEHICRLTFAHPWAIRGFNSEYSPYEYEKHSRSCIYEIVHSVWLADETSRRSKNYPEWRKHDSRTYHHYLVKGHDNYYEVIASGFVEESIARDEAGELTRLIDEA